jgi:hypothetical protein
MRHLGRDILKFAAENENIVPTLWPCAAWLGNAKVTHCALDLRVAEQDLNGAQVTGCLVNDRVSLCRLKREHSCCKFKGRRPLLNCEYVALEMRVSLPSCL